MPDREGWVTLASSGEKARVFFALWPDAAAAAQMHAIARTWHHAVGGRVSREDSLHATLVFIGDIAMARLPGLFDLAAGIDLPGFPLMFDRRGCWRHNRIAYLGVSEKQIECAGQVPLALLNLQSELAGRVRSAGFVIENRPFSPHITLIRKADCVSATKENPAIEPVSWSVRDFVLVKSSMNANGSRYEQIGRWPLL